MKQIEADYLVIGTGAVGMTFVDTMLDESEANFIMVDRHHMPGGTGMMHTLLCDFISHPHFMGWVRLSLAVIESMKPVPTKDIMIWPLALKFQPILKS